MKLKREEGGGSQARAGLQPSRRPSRQQRRNPQGGPQILLQGQCLDVHTGLRSRHKGSTVGPKDTEKELSPVGGRRVLFLFLFLFFIFYLFMRDTEREAETQAEGEAGSLQGAGCGTRPQDHALSQRQTDAQPLSYPGIPGRGFLHFWINVLQ